MKVLIITSILVVPTLMLYLQHLSGKFRQFFNIGVVVASIIFGSIAATSIYQIIVDDAVFMTTIHAVFLNPLFLVVGAYMGVFMIYRWMLLTLEDK
ncbi:transposase [Lysinibacillus sp. NPDC048646]|uniref:transposase n=1 Tax=Lysinibacillus sp. NPDC048646 TaxID=3390574 RepID=UPI003D0819AB